MWYILMLGGHMSSRILIIEDDEAILKFLRRGLAYEGYQVDTAADGQSGLDTCP
jgi:two-component system, OmpR family, response regulator MprA